MLIGEHGGDPMMAHIAMMQALHRHQSKPTSAPGRKLARTYSSFDDPDAFQKKQGPGFLRGPTLPGARGTSARVAISFYIAHSRPAAGERLVFPQ
jgi:hypothetical protein